jgi:ATP-dependent exoDNAse (exonuclease V) beta subunit
MCDVSGDKIDWRDPLAGRWLRYWPWPLGQQKKDVMLDVLAANSEEGREVIRQEREERARLLYVGATRARDYLILAFQKPEKHQVWLDELIDEHGNPVMSFPEEDDAFCYVNGVKHVVNTDYPKPLEILEDITLDTAYAHSQAEVVAYPPMAIRPSDQGGNQDAEIIEEIHIGERMPFAGTPDMNMLGEAVHRFFAADNPKYSEDKRLLLASRILKSWNVIEITPADLVKAATRFWQYIQNSWPDSRIHREAPIIWRDGNRTLNGRIDAFVELDDRIIIIDHKSFPGDRSKWLDQAKKYAGQLHLYAEAVSVARSHTKKIEIFLHLPISGVLLSIK